MKKTEGVWYCDRHKDGVAKTGVAQKCPECSEDMREIGFVETMAGDDE